MKKRIVCYIIVCLLLFIYKFLTLNDNVYWFSDFGDDGYFVKEALNNEFKLADFYPNNLLIKIGFYFSESVYFSIFFYHVFVFFIALLNFNLLTKLSNKPIITLLAILTCSDFWFTSHYVMRDQFILLGISFFLLNFNKLKKKGKISLVLITALMRPFALLFLFLGRVKKIQTIIVISSIIGLIYVSDFQNEVLSYLINPSHSITNGGFDAKSVLENRFNSDGSNNQPLIIKFLKTFTRPLSFHNPIRSITRNNGYSNMLTTRISVSSDIIFQNFGALLNILYLPILCFAILKGFYKKNIISFSLILGFVILSILSYGQQRHSLMLLPYEMILLSTINLKNKYGILR